MSSSSATNQPTILITGASGMLGRSLHRFLLRNADEYNVIGTGLSRLSVHHYHEHYPSPSSTPHEEVKLYKLNLLDHKATSSFLQTHRPDIIVHCAAERYPDAFEQNVEASFQLNVDATKFLAQECLRHGKATEKDRSTLPKLIYISTSYVFDGGVSSLVYPPYKPDSKVNPLNNYGRSKWEGECAVRDVLNVAEEGDGQGIIVRVPLLYGEDCIDLKESPALEMMKVHLSPTPQGVQKIDDWALRFPTSVEDVSRVLKLMIDQLLTSTATNDASQINAGTYHVASPHGVTKYQLFQLQSKLMKIPVSIMDSKAVGGNSGPPENSAPRPQCTQLDCEDTSKALGCGGNVDGREKYTFVPLEEGMMRALSGFPDRFEKKK
jgi:dTDP-4-dehydrorhamnose reductase